MKRLYAEQINKMLEDYYFNLENNPQGRESHYCVLASGIQHIYGAAFCLNDDDTLSELRPLVNDIMNGDIPKPYDLLSLEAEQSEPVDPKGKTMTFVNPLAITVELTPEMVQQLKETMAAIPKRMIKPFYQGY